MTHAQVYALSAIKPSIHTTTIVDRPHTAIWMVKGATDLVVSIVDRANAFHLKWACCQISGWLFDGTLAAVGVRLAAP